MSNGRKTIRGMLHILCALALFAVGFAHKAPVLAQQLSPAELAAYTLPDGTIPDLCLPGADIEGKGKGHIAGNDCEACRISASTILPLPADSTGVPIRVASKAILPVRFEALYRQLFPPNTSPRAPPSGLIA